MNAVAVASSKSVGKKRECGLLMNRCENCGYHYKDDDDRFPCCHFEGPEGWAPCEQDEYEEETAD